MKKKVSKPPHEDTEDEPVKNVSANVINLLRQAGEREEIDKPHEHLKECADKAGKLAIEIGELKDQLKQKEVEYEHLVKHEIPLAMLKMGVVKKDNKGRVSLEDGSEITLRNTNYPFVLAADNSKLTSWLREIGHEADLKETVHFKTLQKIVTGYIDSGKEKELPAFLKVFKKTRAVIRLPKTEE